MRCTKIALIGSLAFVALAGCKQDNNYTAVEATTEATTTALVPVPGPTSSVAVPVPGPTMVVPVPGPTVTATPETKAAEP